MGRPRRHPAKQNTTATQQAMGRPRRHPAKQNTTATATQQAMGRPRRYPTNLSTSTTTTTAECSYNDTVATAITLKVVTKALATAMFINWAAAAALWYKANSSNYPMKSKQLFVSALASSTNTNYSLKNSAVTAVFLCTAVSMLVLDGKRESYSSKTNSSNCLLRK